MKKTVTPSLLSEQQRKRLSRVYDDFFQDMSSLAEKAQNIASGAVNGQPKASAKTVQTGKTGSAAHSAPAAAGSAGPAAGSSGPAAGRKDSPAPAPAPASGPAQAAELPVATAAATDQPVNQPQAQPEAEEDPMETLQNLIGLETIKKDVKELIDFVKVQKARKEAGLKSVPVSLHLVFTGNPGTGKTTVARIIAKLYQQIGVLAKGQLIEVDRSGLVAGYVGQTAIKTQEQIGKALGGVLFIDEAYALSQKDDAFGQEAIETILKAMEDHRDDLVVIVAGYTEPMEKFINSNPGLKSRFNKYIEFPDYSMDELMGIFDLNCRKYDYVIDEDTRKHVREQLSLRRMATAENFANAREVRNMFEEIITNQATRVALMENPSQEDMMKICSEDLEDLAVPKDRSEGDPLGKLLEQFIAAEENRAEDAAPESGSGKVEDNKEDSVKASEKEAGAADDREKQAEGSPVSEDTPVEKDNAGIKEAEPETENSTGEAGSSSNGKKEV